MGFPWIQKEKTSKGEEAKPADDTKPCCSEKNDAEDSQDGHTAQPSSLAVSTFDFLGSVHSDVRLTGVCQSSDPSEIKACLWSPTHAAVRNRVYF